jgi:peptide subunit release factor 1 (eRF1)
MLKESDLKELLEYQAQHPLLSVYLNTEPAEGGADAYRLRLRSMLKDIDLKDDVKAVERYFDHEFDWSGRSVAVFSCAPEKFFRAYTLAVPIRSRVRTGNYPHVKALADLLDAYGGYGVALVDKQGARLFYFHLGELREQEGTMGETVHHTKSGGASTFPGRKSGIARRTSNEEDVIEKNMKEAADFASHFFADNNVRRVLIGGTDDNVASFRNFLPKAWQSLIVGVFPMGMTASKDEVLAKAMHIGKEAEQRREARIVDMMITGAAKGKGSVIRLDDTLGALHDGRIQTLVILDGFSAPGYRCTGCGFITAQDIGTCPYCGHKFENIPDAVEMAVHQVMKLGGEVEVLHESQMGETFGNIGAILRY